MNRNDEKQNIRRDPPDPLDRYVSGGAIPWKKTKAAAWREIEERLGTSGETGPKVRSLNPHRSWIAWAASIAFLVTVTGIMRFYTREFSTRDNTMATVEFPDGSAAELNGESSLSYHPLWWNFQRHVSMEGEAFFRVEKGAAFRVVSGESYTEVLGTRFTILSREGKYRVSCHQGSVQVGNRTVRQSVVLSPGEEAALEDGAGFSVRQRGSGLPEPAWSGGMITFSSAPLHLVLEEVERQYGIRIDMPETPDLVYSGNFSVDQPVEQVLSLLCLPFDLEYENTGGNRYRIYPSGGK